MGFEFPQVSIDICLVFFRLESSDPKSDPKVTQRRSETIFKNHFAAAFWDQRWKRYWEVALPYLYGGVGLPIALLLIGSFLVWVGRGFARDKPRLG